MDNLDSEDWARIQRLGVLPTVREPVDYLGETALGAARAEQAFRFSRNIIPNVSEIKFLHKVMFSDVHPWAGQFRKEGQEVVAGDLVCCWAADITRELKNLNKEMLSNPLEGDRQYKAEIICYYHAIFEEIHPFLDGNGRIGRIILDGQTQKLLGRQIDFNGFSRKEYIAALGIARNEGNLGPVADLILSHSIALKAPSINELRRQEKKLLRERRELGFRGTELEAAYGLAGYPKPLTEKDALALAQQQKDHSIQIEERLRVILADDRKLNRQRKLVNQDLLAVRQQLVRLSEETSLNLGISRKLKQ